MNERRINPFLDWLFDKAPDESTPPPPNVLPPDFGLPYAPPEGDDDAMMQSLLESGSYDLEQVVTAIDYMDVKGRQSRRRITTRVLKLGPQAPVLQAVCHERSDVRSFRCDRIECFITSDGEVIEPNDFFRETFSIDLSKSLEETSDPHRKLREALIPGLSILITAARVDNEFHDLEFDAIMNWVRQKIRHLNTFEPDGHEEQAFLAAIKRTSSSMRPQRSSLPKHLAKLFLEEDGDGITLFTQALDAVVEADGVILPAERGVITELERLVDDLAEDPVGFFQSYEI